MRIKTISAQLNIISLVFKGLGKPKWGNAARLAAMALNEENASLAERSGINFKAFESSNDLIIELCGAVNAAFKPLISAALNPSGQIGEHLYAILESDLIFEQSNYNLQSARGFSQELLGIKNDKSLPDSAKMSEYFAAFKNCALEILFSQGAENVELKSPKKGWLELESLESQQNQDLKEFLASCEKNAASNMHLKLNRSSFIKRQKASCSQSFIYFGANLYELDLAQRACAAIASMAFGAGFSSRITELIRVQNGLAYSAYARIAYAQNHAYWLGNMQTKSSNEAKALELLKEQYLILESGINEEEFNTSKAYLINSAVLENKDFASIHKLALSRLQANLPEDFNERLNEQIAATSLENVNEFLRTNACECSFYIVGENE